MLSQVRKYVYCKHTCSFAAE